MSAKKFLIAALSTAALAVPFDGSLEDRQANCASLWGQCGGNGWSGATCCSSGSHCAYVNDWYSQCQPGAGTTPTKTTTTAKPTTTTQPTTTAQPTTTTKPTGTTTRPPGASITASYTGNPFSGVQLWANDYYRSEVLEYAVPTLGPNAAKVAEVPSFQWMDTRAKVDVVRRTLGQIRAANQAGANPPYAGQFVVYDLPDRDCAAAASNGEFAISDGGVAKYKEYIDAIADMFTEYSDIRLLLVIEPDSLANLVTNLHVPKCANAKDAYLECTNYAVTKLDLPNVAQYLDGGHGGWLGWPANLPGAAEVYTGVYKRANQPKSLRGFATNVANYNGWSLSVAPEYTKPNPNYDEKRYINAFAPMLRDSGWPDARFIIDQGRSGKQPTGQIQQGHWCNAVGTGFGLRPSTNTGDPLADAFVWVKPGGESDGTSDTTAKRYDHHCGMEDALKPAPEAGQWFEKYFEMLYNNANPSFR
ncbi:hypothetical protein DL767_001367 [Monosporascus sp. MG133]|nr:hypothetical protein DL767_001367 [Monosporascus sp. MG133]